MSKHTRWAAAAALIVLAATSLQSAGAGTVAQQGWWHRLPVVIGAPAVDQLLVEGTPDEAMAIAAVRFTLADGEVAETLILPVAEQQLQPGATIIACSTATDWEAVEGGGWEARPMPSCESAVEGVLADDGASWSFEIGALQDGTQMDVVLLPAPNVTMRVVFEPVTGGALGTQAGDGGSTPEPGPPSDDDGGAPAPGAERGTTSPSLDLGSGGGSDTFVPPPSGSGTVTIPPTASADEPDPDTRAPAVRGPEVAAPATPTDLAAATDDAGGSPIALAALLAAAVLTFVALKKGEPEMALAPAGVLAHAGSPPIGTTTAVPAGAGAVPEPPDLGDPLVVSDISVHFGGVRALDHVSIRVGPGEIVGLIGGNGAGKTTLMDCVSGYVIPDEGSITTFGHELVGTSPEMRPYLDVARGYQSARLYPGLTVQETLLVALERTRPTGVLAGVLRLRHGRDAEAVKRQRADEVIQTLGLGAYRDNRVGELSTGTRRVLDVACMLAQQPKLLLLDEPTAGLAQRETEAFGPLLQRLQRQLGCAILIIEHDIVLISSVCDRVYALETGRVLAEGDPDAVRQDPRVIASYLGTDEAAIFRSGSGSEPAPGVEAASPRTRSAPRRPRRGQPLRAPQAAALDDLSRVELIGLAAERGIPGRHRMRKDEIVGALRDSGRTSREV